MVIHKNFLRLFQITTPLLIESFPPKIPRARHGTPWFGSSQRNKARQNKLPCFINRCSENSLYLGINYKPSTCYLVITYFLIYLPIYETYLLQNWLPRWNQTLIQLRFIHNWIIMGIQWMVHWWVLVDCGHADMIAHVLSPSYVGITFSCNVWENLHPYSRFVFGMNFEPSRFSAPNLIHVKDAGYVW